jgi:hypothetical protein
VNFHFPAEPTDTFGLWIGCKRRAMLEGDTEERKKSKDDERTLRAILPSKAQLLQLFGM